VEPIMARVRLKKLWPVALSLDAASEALQVRRKYLSDAIAAGNLDAHVIDHRVRIAVADLVAFLKSHPLKRRVS
jgi:hypothetical protein